MQKIRNKTLQVIYQSGASYDDLMQLRNSVSLMNIYKSTGTLNLQSMWPYFKYREAPYNLKTACSAFYSTHKIYNLWYILTLRFNGIKKLQFMVYTLDFHGSLKLGIDYLVISIWSISEFKIIKKIGNID